MSCKIDELRAAAEQNPHDPKLWLELGTEIAAESKDFDECIEVFSRGLCYSPFDADLHLQRGRKFIASGRYSQTIADITLACRLNPNNWENWYYLSVGYNLWGKYKESAEGFLECAKHVPEKAGLYPVVDWLFTTYTKIGDREKAKACLNLIDTDIPSSTMDYSYRKRVMLFKGLIDPEKFIDEEEMKQNCLKTKDRPQLEMVTQLYGLANYYSYLGEMEKSDAVLLKLLEQPLFHNAFGYIKGVMDAKDRGLIK